MQLCHSRTEMLARVLAACQLPASPQELLLVLFIPSLRLNLQPGGGLISSSLLPAASPKRGSHFLCHPQEGADVGHEDPFVFQDVSADAGLFCKKSGTVRQTCK